MATKYLLSVQNLNKNIEETESVMDNVNQEASMLLEDLKQIEGFDVKTMEDDLRKVRLA